MYSNSDELIILSTKPNQIKSFAPCLGVSRRRDVDDGRRRPPSHAGPRRRVSSASISNEEIARDYGRSGFSGEGGRRGAGPRARACPANAVVFYAPFLCSNRIFIYVAKSRRGSNTVLLDSERKHCTKTHTSGEGEILHLCRVKHYPAMGAQPNASRNQISGKRECAPSVSSSDSRPPLETITVML
ncbi:hypothetical protein EVAR_77905_1 [Eumeta japonica]|uniref:Uncharacterized protein n=1 Tax=Eumeta variegata TaxID=151549 RepID=A0A4C1ZAJ1_EUMVA|nr:hypothetical protein EVAR_77905_1 [Eumeta japonica]